MRSSADLLDYLQIQESFARYGMAYDEARIDVLAELFTADAVVELGRGSGKPFATLTGSWAVNDPAAINVAQIVISGTTRHTPPGALSMPAFGRIYSDAEIAAVANYVTARFGTKGAQLTERDVAALRQQTAQ